MTTNNGTGIMWKPYSMRMETYFTLHMTVTEIYDLDPNSGDRNSSNICMNFRHGKNKSNKSGFAISFSEHICYYKNCP
jgi:hypothetical protein